MPATIYKFDRFELDPARYELRRDGRVLKLERIPMELLLLLLERNGSVASRQEIVERLWGKDVFVDTEHGINTAVRKIRQVLRDGPEEPRFIQTVSGKGYRFVAGSGTVPADFSNEAAASSPENQIPVSSTERRRLPPLQGISRKGWTAIAALVLLLAAATLLAFNAGASRDHLFKPNPASQIHSVAVLPLANLSGDSSQDYFADGMTDEVITMLAKNTQLRVVSRTSAMRFKGANRPMAEIGQELGVDGILEGSISRSADRVHMTVQLIHAPTDTHIWADSYDRDPAQAMSLPSEVARSIAKETNAITSAASRQRYVSPEAHDAYLRGHYFWFSGNDKRSQEFFEKAIQLQPDYAAAWAGLSSAYALRAVGDECPSKDVVAQVEATARRAVELDPSLAEAHHSLGAYYLFYAWDPSRADVEMKRAIELDPTISEQHHLRSYVLFVMKRNDEALEEQKRASELDPFARPWTLGRAYLMLRQFDAAIAELRLREEAMPNRSLIHGVLMEAYWSKRMRNEAAQEFLSELNANGTPEKADAARKAFDRGGFRALAQWSLHDLKSGKGYISPMETARAYSYLEDKENTLKSLEQAYREHHPWLIMVQDEPEFDFIHSEPRYQALIEKIGLPKGVH